MMAFAKIDAVPYQAASLDQLTVAKDSRQSSSQRSRCEIASLARE